MCGIFGWVSHDVSLSASNVEYARQMTGLLHHRGPDGVGEWHDDRTFMGHRRLSVIDLSSQAAQPFHDPTGRYVLIYNGEIYNYIELRKELETAGLLFTTDSDTEVMLAALITWGDAALARFDGMFAAALHDRKTGRHLIFRDPLGQKPLYYFSHAGGIIYASELRSIISLPGFAWRIDRDSFQRYVMHGYYTCAETPISGVRKLLPGHILRIQDGTSAASRYWNSVPGYDPLDISSTEAIGEFQRLFRQSCQRAMRADVPYGVFLSGGIDSSLIVDFCKELNPDIRSFSISMGERDFDESTKAELVVRHLGIKDQHTFSMNRDSVVEATSAVLGSADEPHADPGFVNSYFLAKCCRPYLTVALSGDGGDELFAGYLPFAGLRGIAPLKFAPQAVLNILKHTAGLIPENDRYVGLRFKLQSYLRGFPASDSVRFALWLSAIDPEKAALLCPSSDGFFDRRNILESSAFAPIERIMSPVAGGTTIQQLLYFYQKVFLPEFVCMHTDRAAMQFGLEVRSPFLSPEMVSFANRLPDKMKLTKGVLKWLPKQVAGKRGLPDQIIHQKKQGFTFPIARWLKSSLKPLMMDLLNIDEWAADRLVDTTWMAHLIDDHVDGRNNNYRILYNLMCFRAWRRKFPHILPPA